MFKILLKLITFLLFSASAKLLWDSNFTSDLLWLTTAFWLFLHLLLWVKSAF